MHAEFLLMPIPVAVWSKAWVCGRSHAGNEGLNPTGGMDDRLLWVLTCCQGQSLFQNKNSPTKCMCILECDQMQQ